MAHDPVVKAVHCDAQLASGQWLTVPQPFTPGTERGAEGFELTLELGLRRVDDGPHPGAERAVPRTVEQGRLGRQEVGEPRRRDQVEQRAHGRVEPTPGLAPPRAHGGWQAQVEQTASAQHGVEQGVWAGREPHAAHIVMGEPNGQHGCPLSVPPPPHRGAHPSKPDIRRGPKPLVGDVARP
jgi:hypothetical protein